MNNILMVNTTVVGGGAAGMMKSLGNGLVSRGWTVNYAYAKSPRLLRLGWSALTSDDIRWGQDITTTHEYQEADVVHLHNVHGGYFPLRVLPQIAREKKLVWTLHDLWAIQSRSPVDGNVSRRAYPPMLRDKDNDLLQRKKDIYSKINKLHVVVPSRWLAGKIKKSSLAHFPIHYIPHGIDTTIFHPGNRERARSIVQLPKETKIVLFVASGGIKNPYKGGNIILECARQLRDIMFVVVGGTMNKTVGNIRYIPTVETSILAQFYRAANVVITPSLYEVYGLVVAEAVASGVPVIGFATGGIPEIVRGQKHSILCKAGDAQALIEAIRKQMSVSKLDKIHIPQFLHMNKMIDAYDRLYKRI